MRCFQIEQSSKELYTSERRVDAGRGSSEPLHLFEEGATKGAKRHGILPIAPIRTYVRSIGSG